MESKKVVIFPQGPVADDATSLNRRKKSAAFQNPHEKYKELLVYCGGDLDRMHDQKFGSFQQLVFYLTRLNKPDKDEARLFQSPTIVALTQSCPLSVTVSLRADLCAAIQDLEQALWILYVDLSLDPSFPDFALRLGWFEEMDMDEDAPDFRKRIMENLGLAPYWQDTNKRRYLILVRELDDPSLIRQRAAQLYELVRFDWQKMKNAPNGGQSPKSSGLSQSFRTLASQRTRRS